MSEITDVKERPVVFLDLNAACSALGMFIWCAYNFIPEEEWPDLANQVRPHLQGAAAVLAEFADRNKSLLDSCREDRIQEVVRRERNNLVHHLSGRRFIGPGNRFRHEQYYDSQEP
jgi:hypothetical protein